MKKKMNKLDNASPFIDSRRFVRERFDFETQKIDVYRTFVLASAMTRHESECKKRTHGTLLQVEKHVISCGGRNTYDKRSLKFAYKYVHDEKYHDQFNACVAHTHNCGLATEEDFSKIVAAYNDESESKGRTSLM